MQPFKMGIEHDWECNMTLMATLRCLLSPFLQRMGTLQVPLNEECLLVYHDRVV